jgi:SAM-dependent methyltransferase
MGVWANNEGIRVGNQESMDGRAEVMLKKLRSELLSTFTLAQISTMSIVDIGCNDGWLLHNLSDLPFKSMTGVEPREKNVKKGFVVREELQLQNNIEFLVGDTTTLGSRTFDIVVCTGVLYHVESIPFFLRELKKICNNYIFIESRTIDSGLLSKQTVKQSELVDLPYKFDTKLIGMSVHKFESAYSDGSAHIDTVVSLPTPETIVMYLQSLDFEDIKLVLGAKTFRQEINRKDRPLDGVCITARVTNSDEISSYKKFKTLGSQSAKKVESIYEHTILPLKVLNLVQSLGSRNKPIYPKFSRKLWMWLQPANFHNDKIEYQILKYLSLDSNQKIIFRDLKFSPQDKINLELAKLDFYNGQYYESRTRLENILNKPNADWRSIFRAYYFLILIGKRLQDSKLILDAENSLRTSNPNHPYFSANKDE